MNLEISFSISWVVFTVGLVSLLVSSSECVYFYPFIERFVRGGDVVMGELEISRKMGLWSKESSDRFVILV